MTSIGLILVAGGLGKRMSQELPKQFLDLQSKPVFVRALEPFLNFNFECVVMTFPVGFLDKTNFILNKFGLTGKVELIEGGKERHHSVWNALNYDRVRSCDFVLIHDAVRPFVSVMLIQKIIEQLKIEKAVVPAVVAKDTIKQINSSGCVEQTLNRQTCLLVQTPQAFETKYLYDAYEFIIARGIQITDDASAIEQIGGKVKVIEGEESNIKITSQLDFKFAKFLAAEVFR